MAITVRELLALPHLRMTLIAGAGGLDREITWVHTSPAAGWPGPSTWPSGGSRCARMTCWPAGT
jgi:purine catabolism regulator